MPFAFKLSRRLSRIRRVLTVFAAAGVFAQCEAVPSSDLTGPAGKTRRVLPLPVTDFKAIDPTDSSVSLSFTEVDDGMQNPANYGIRYGVAPMNWESTTSITASPCADSLKGYAIGAPRTCVVTGLAPSTDYEFQVVPYRTSGSGDTTIGPVSAAAPVTTLAAVAALTLSPASINVVAGQGVQLTARLLDALGNVLTRSIVWASTDSSVATVNATGGVTSRKAGTVAILAWSPPIGAYTRINVSPVATSPAAVTDLTVSARNDSSVSLSFTEVTDGSGRAANYSIRYAVSPLTFGSGTQVSRGTCSVPVAGGSIGARRTCTVLGLTGLTNYGFQLVSFRGSWGANDAVYGPLSNQATGATTSLVSAVAVTPATASLTVGQTSQLTAVVRDAGGRTLTGRTVTWSTSAGSVAQVSSGGLVSAAGAGSATITATSDGKTGQARINVSGPAAVPVATVTVAPSPVSLSIGQTSQLTATTRDAAGNVLSGRSVTWSSNATGVAQVNGSGLVTAVAAGNATMTATSEGRTATVQVAVAAAALTPVATVTVSPSPVALSVGQTSQLSAATRDASGNMLTGRSITWSSSGSAVASVSATGMVTANGPGTATITATSEGRAGSSQFSITTIPVATVALNPSAANVTAGQTSQLTASLRDAAGNALTGRTISWTTSSSTVATVSTSGLVTARAAGAATITATSEGRTGTSQFNVTVAPVASVAISPTSLNLTVGQNSQLTVAVRDAGGNTLTGRAVTWSSSASGVAAVSTTGVVTASAAGATTITATSEGRSAQAQVTVSGVSSGGLAWFSDWRSATGNASSVIRDGTKWTGESGNGRWLDVISAGGMGFPSDMANVLRSNTPGTTLSHMLMVTGKWATPPVGGSVYYRVYFRSAIPDGTDMGSSHPLQNGLSNLAWEWKILNPENGHQVLAWVIDPLINNYPHQVFDSGNNTNRKTPLIVTNTTYRLEWQIQRVTTTTGKVTARVYDSANNLVFTNANFWAEANGSFVSLATDNPDIQLNNVDAAFQEINLGNNGPLVGSRAGNNYEYWGGFAVSTTGWCGPYSSTRG